MGRLIIDLPRLLSGDVSADIILQDGDILDIPKFTNAVTVVGEVRRPSSFVRQESYMLDDYIELAAGMTARGNKKQIYIIMANGSVDQLFSNTSSRFLQFSDTNDNILAGHDCYSYKVIYQTPLNLYQTVSQVVFQSIASIAAFSTILKINLMEIENQNQSVSIGVVILIILSLILTGLHGLISIIFLMIISRLNIGRDQR